MSKEGINNDESFYIKVLDSYHIEYSEGDHSLQIYVDFREQVPEFTLEEISSWKSPYDKEVIPKEKRLRIFRNIHGYLKKEGYEKIYIQGYGYIE